MKTRILTITILLSILLLVLTLLNLLIGSSSLSAREALQILFLHDTSSTYGTILWTIRMPRLVAAILLGGALSVSGFLLQTFFGNPIAGPYILGISSGAKLVVAVVMILCLKQGLLLSAFLMIAAAFLGSLVVMGFVLMIQRKVHQMSVLIICGIMVGYICSSVTEFLVTFADDANIVNLHHWSMGSFSAITGRDDLVIGIVVAVAMVVAILLSKPMSAYQMGEAYAGSVGVDLRKFRISLILLSSLLSATVTAFAGPISFVGIAVPHLVRLMTKTARPIILVPLSFLGGAVFCLLCDLLARSLFAPTELSISAVTAVFGAPVVILMLMQKRTERADE